MAETTSFWNRGLFEKDSGWGRAFMILWIDKSGLMCKCGHLSDSHFHECVGFGGNYLGSCTARFFTCSCKDFQYLYKPKPKKLLEIGID